MSPYFIIYKLLNKNLNVELGLGEGSRIKFLVFWQSSKQKVQTGTVKGTRKKVLSL